MKFFLFICFFLLSAGPILAGAGTSEQLLKDLQTALASKQDYDAQRWNRISVLTDAFISSKRNDEAKFDLGLRIYEEYKAFKYDSAFVYSQKITRIARQLNSPEKTEVAKLKLAFILLSSGMFKETFDELNSIRPSYLSQADKLDFYFLQARAYSDLGNFNQDQAYRPAYNTKALAYADTALRFSQPGSYEQLAVQQFKAVKSGNLPEGVALYQRIRRLPQLSVHQLAVSASTTAYIYSQLRQEDKAFELLLVSAIADVQSATKETVAIFQLSDYCYRRGDLENAYAFIKEAREQAAFYKARQRQIEISHISSVIEGQKITIIENQRKSLKVYAVAVTLLALFVVGFIVIIFKQLRKLQKAGRLISITNQELQARNEDLRRLNTGLNEANKIKEEYIGYYFHNNSQLIDRLEALKKALDTQLSSKQYGAVQKLVNGIQIKQQRQELFKGFDSVFLRLFPQFITQFNALFRPEDQFILPEDQLLTTELRIFALIRLGIQDSEQISRMLGYSINTIYTYKTRVKNRSIVPNEEFEARIQAIEAV
ncbi:DUF6377 domain-containing protein [Hymenobacter endophyticus]|uniref:DUF6377 domain-containing protein n=1 Tax=Hymenobacter endophyticus TaxID=3076335 RepID=A0ABU3TBX6_9BACT|nr:DUF6377 domain-containing protein [Hymenobacter endophyticus]MDU0368855.1 DUF6377 domain-containing protein [Hymenobacter endophyticus]